MPKMTPEHREKIRQAHRARWAALTLEEQQAEIERGAAARRRATQLRSIKYHKLPGIQTAPRGSIFIDPDFDEGL